MPYHDLSFAQSLVKRHIHDLKTQAKSLFKRKSGLLDLPPSLSHYNDPPPNHWMGCCKTAITPQAATSPALHRVVISNPAEGFVPVKRLAGAHLEQIPYFAVCTCGLSHRAREYKPSVNQKWKNFPRIPKNEAAVGKFRRFVKHKDDGDVTLIEFKHIQCNKCYKYYDAYRWQHFVLHRDAVFHIDGRDEYGRWAEVHHKE
ncbi:hypothetical protein PMIN01_11270 [Paraphaeosphaeria minitans]|uniref:Uncharacterized protein n=1 Tax=Paraphaeosphaeria minitans TaxID=565426 RepID=A0A9P6G775_9PLEO|nr:hypothetical protein PMIN01_11270 [Paraphaeosphaeria minitans]